MSSKLNTIISSIILLLGSFTFVQAAEINMPGFSGSINTTITSGFSMRADRDCLGVRGQRTLGAKDVDNKYADFVAANLSSDSAVYLKDSEGCASRYTDGYGNTGLTTSGSRDLISANADNGRTNYNSGDIFDVTQRLYSEITGTTDNGTSVNLSFVGTYNPLIDVAGNPDFAPFSAEQKDELQSDMRVLNAYISTDIDAIDATVTAGRFVTSWGEATFIPIGMNGLTTNALNLTSLRVPGSSIKEALMPTEQITLSGYLDNGWSYEAYYQYGESHIETDEEGQFFGSDVLDQMLVVSGQYSGNSQERSAACNFFTTAPALAGGQGLSCGAQAVALHNSAAGPLTEAQYLIQAGMKNLFGGSNAATLAHKVGTIGYGAAAAWTGSNGDLGGLAVAGGATAAMVANTFANWDEYDRKQGVKIGAIDTTNNGHIYADGDDQYGLALRTYLDDVGTGLDLGIYFSQYDSKVPYLRFKGQQGLTAADLLGVFTLAAQFGSGGDWDQYLLGLGATDDITDLSATERAGGEQLYAALIATAYGEAACNAYQKDEAADELYNGGAMGANAAGYTSEQTSNALTAYNYTAYNGKLYHDSLKCYANAQNDGSGMDFNTAATQNAAAALLGAAVTPLNYMSHEFIYPENLQVLGVSANTNIGPMTVQAEIAYRPDFPLATDGGDQGQQMSDAAGTSTLLASAVAQGAIGNGLGGTITSMYQAGTGNGSATLQDALTAIKSFKRSSLPAISSTTVASGDYYSTPYIEYDTWTATVGTTSTFTASHPITTSLGADSSVFLTELGIVHVDGLDDAANGNIARGGYRDGVGGNKCGGVTNGGTFGPTTFSGATSGVTHLGSAQTDPLFGNGSYCESQNSIDATSMTYRLIGSATYNNIGNTPWTFSPSLVWAHDFSGYGPVSMGGFVPGKQSLSLGASLSKGSVRASVNYVNQLGDEMDNLAFDMDYVSASMSYAF